MTFLLQILNNVKDSVHGFLHSLGCNKDCMSLLNSNKITCIFVG